MKKKLIAALVAGVVLSVGLIGLTACNNGNGGYSINKGEEVDEAGWIAATDATSTAQNFTVDVYGEETLKITGTYGNATNVNVTKTGKTEGKMYFDFFNSTYITNTRKIEVSNVPDALKEYDNFKSGTYLFERYQEKDGETYYDAQYSEDFWEGWRVYENPTLSNNEIVGLFNQYYSTTETGNTFRLYQLYGEFTYSEGVYTATLWSFGGETKVSLSIKDGYVVGICKEYGYVDEYTERKEVTTLKEIYNFSNYGTTTVNPSDAAKQAIEDHKETQN